MAATFAEELSRLSRPRAWVLQGAGVVGDLFGLGAGSRRGGVSEADLLAALDELTGSALVRQTATLAVPVRAPMVRRAVYETARAAGGSGPAS